MKIFYDTESAMNVPDELMTAGMRAWHENASSSPGNWSAEEQVRAIIAAVVPLVRQTVADELVALRDGIEGKHKPYNQAFMHTLDCAIRHVTRGGPDA